MQQKNLSRSIFCVLAITVSLFVPQGVYSNFAFVKHILNDTLKADTVFHTGSAVGPTQAVVNLVARSKEGLGSGINVIIASDFTMDMRNNALDTSVAKMFLVAGAVRKFIDNHLDSSDGIALMRYAFKYAIFPEREMIFTKRSVSYKVRVEAGGRVVLCDTLDVARNCTKYLSDMWHQYDSDLYENCAVRHTFGNVLGGIDRFGQPWGRNHLGVVVDSVRIGGVGYVLDTVLNDSVLYVEGNPPLSAKVSMVANRERTNYGQRFPRDEVYADTFYYMPGHLTGQAVPIQMGRYSGTDIFTLDQYQSYGVEKIWYQFSRSYYTSWDPLGGPSGAFDSSKSLNLVDPTAVDFGWTDFSNQHLDDRIHGGNRALYYNVWQAVRYALTHNDKSKAPVVIFLTSGKDDDSPKAFRRAMGQGGTAIGLPFPVPSHFQNILSDTSFNQTRAQFESFMIDSIGDRVALYTIALDTISRPISTTYRPDYFTLYKASNQGMTNNKRFHVLAGSDLDSVYTLIGGLIKEAVARPITNAPMFVDMVNKLDGARLVEGSIRPNSGNSINLDSVVVDSTGDYYYIRFYSKPLDAGVVFDYLYTVQADITAPSLTVKPIILNPDPIYSRVQFINTLNQTVTEPFNQDTLYVKSSVDRLLLSRNGTTLDTTGIGSGSRLLSYTMLTPAVDTSNTYYSLLRLTGSNNSVSLIPVNASWDFNPLAWLPESRSVSLASASSATPHAVVTYADAGIKNKSYPLTARYINPQTGAWMTAALTYNAGDSSTPFTTEVAIAEGAPSVAQKKSTRDYIGTVDVLGDIPPITLYAIGLSTADSQFHPVTATWSVVSGFNHPSYAHIRTIVNGTSAPSVSFSLSPNEGSPVSQSDSGIIRIQYTNEINQLKTFEIYIRILDQTDRSTPNVIAIFLKSDFEPFMEDNAANHAKLESLFVAKYSLPPANPLTITRSVGAAADTTIQFYALLFSDRLGTIRYKGLDTLANWSVVPGVSVAPPAGNGFTLTYTNHFALRNDVVRATSSYADSIQRTVRVNWTYGNGRFLHLESRNGSINDNVTTRIVDKEYSLLDIHIDSDTVYANLRDEFGNFIQYNDTVEWRVTNPGFTPDYVNFSVGNPSIISKVQNGSKRYYFTATIPAGRSIAGTGELTTTALRDTLEIVLSADGYDSMRVVVSGGKPFTSGGTTFQDFESIPTSTVLDIRAGDSRSDSLHPSFTAYIHKIGETGVLPVGWEQTSQQIRWYYKDYSPFGGTPDTQYNRSTWSIKPTHHVPGLIDTMITEWNYNNIRYRDTVRFRTLPPYPTSYTVTFRDTLTAGDSSLFSIRFFDHNGQPVTDPSVLPDSVKLLSTSTTLQFRGAGGWITGLDSIFPHSEAISFNGAACSSYVKVTDAGTFRFTVRIALSPGDTVAITRNIKVQPAAPNSVRIVYRPLAGSPVVDCVADTMDVAALSGKYLPYRLYTALLFDAYGNAITGSLLNNLVWSASGTLDTSVDVFVSSFDQLSYSAQGLNTTTEGYITCRYNPSIADSFSLNVYASIRVSAMSTHEWIADTSNRDLNDPQRLTIPSVLAAVLPGRDVTGMSDSERLALLDSLGYRPFRDGYLDYLNIALSSPIKLSAQCIDSIFTDGLDTLRKYWYVKKAHYCAPGFDSVGFYAIVPNDGTDDPLLQNAHSRYRIWLRPTHKMKAHFSACTPTEVSNLAMETGLKPRIAFNNNVVRTVNNANWIKIGIGDYHVTDTIYVTDSVPPLVSRALFYDNVCSDNKIANYTDVYFSEPLKPVASGLVDWRNKKWFAATRTNGVTDTMILDIGRFIVDTVEPRYSMGKAHPLESGAAGSGTYLTHVRLYHNDSAVASLYLSGSGPKIRLAENETTPFQDRNNFEAAKLPAINVVIKSDADMDMSACKTVGITEVGIPAALDLQNGYNPNTNAPLYPWWGAVLINPLPNAPRNEVINRKVRLTATIYDVIGNLVASHDLQKCLFVEMSWEEAFGTPDGTFAETKLIGYNYLQENVRAKGKVPCGIMLAWNCVNNKGRVVAPGGYLVRIVVDNSVNKSVSTARLIVDNSAK